MNLQAANSLAWSLLRKHGLTSWAFRFDRAKRRFGFCSYRKHEITLSRSLTELNEEAHVLDVILHEVAHALAGSEHHHDRFWRQIARQIGASGTRCYSSAVVVPTGRWIAVCPNCYRTRVRHKRANIACGRCCDQYNDGKYDERFRFYYKPNTLTSWSEINDYKNSIRVSKAASSGGI